MERWLAIPKISAFFPSNRGILVLLSAWYPPGVPVNLTPWHQLPFDRITTANPAVHAISQIIDLFETGNHGNFRSGRAALPRGAGEDDFLVFRQVQVLQCLAE